MSLLSILKVIGKDLLLADQAAAPFVAMFNPAAGAIMNTIGRLVVRAEVTYTEEKQGATKKQMVIDEFTALFPIFQQALKDQAGVILTFDADKVGDLIDATVTQFNATKALHDSLRVVKV